MGDFAPMNLAGALLYGFANLLHPRMLWLMVWPMLVSLVFWSAVAAAFWDRLAAALGALFQRWLEPAARFLHLDPGGAAMVAAFVVLVLLLVPLVYLTAVFILGAFGMQKMVDHVAQRSFPALERRRGGSVAGSVWNSAAALGGMAILFLVSLPLWLLPPLWPLIPLAIFAWTNQKLLRYDALAEHADAPEMARLFRDRRGALLTLGLMFALLAYVPFVGFIAPVLFGLAFIRYLLGGLEELRGAAPGLD
jgi:CysZ protein